MSTIPFPQQPNAPIMPGGQTFIDPALVTQELLGAIEQAAMKSRTASGADCASYAKAALEFAQAVVILDPSLSQGGSPLEHDIAMKGIDHETQKAVAAIQGETAVRVEHVRGQNAREQARETAAAPSPVKQLQGGPGRQS